MAIASQCDRCGKLFLPDEYVDAILVGYRSVTEFSSPYKRMTIDLCPECMRNLEQWMDSYGRLEDLFKEEERMEELKKNAYERMVEEA